MRLARTLGAIGRSLITAGVLILMFVGYQLWGTGIHEARAQNTLEADFAEQLATTSTTEAPKPGKKIELIPPPPPKPGEGVARIRIPAIGVDKIVVEGVQLSDLKRGPGHYPESPLPGNPGNAAIAGHRTTYGAPFNRLDELKPGDDILVTTLQGKFRYVVMPVETVEGGKTVKSGHLIVAPTQTEVLDD
jgi:sortase A